MKDLRWKSSLPCRRQFLRAAGLLGGAALLDGAVPLTPRLAWGQAKKERLRLGFTISTTGGFAYASEQGFRGLKVWLDEVNSQGGVFVKAHGRKLPVEPVYYDDRSDKMTVVRLYEKLITEDKVDIAFAPFGSTLTSAAAAITEKHRIPLIIWSAAADTIYEQGYQYIISATEIPSSLMPRPEMQHMRDLGVKTVAIVYLDEPFPATQAAAAKRFAEEYRMQVTHYEKFAKGTLDFSALLRKVQAAQPQGFYMSAYLAEQTNILRQMKEQNVNFNYVYMVYSGEPVWFKNTGRDGLYIFGHTLFHPRLKWKVNAGMDYDQFMERWNRVFPDVKTPPDFQTSLAYGAGVLLQKYIETGGSLDADAIKKAALALSDKVTVMTGKYAIDKTGKQLYMDFTVTQVREDPGKPGEFRLDLVWPREVATAKEVYPIPKWEARR